MARYQTIPYLRAPMDFKRRQNFLLTGFVLLSLLLHLATFLLVPQQAPLPAPEKKPVYVELRPPAPKPERQPEPRPRELDLTPRPEAIAPRGKPAKRLAAADQIVEKEMAPKGDALEDQRPDAPVPPSPAPKPARVAPKPPASPVRKPADKGPKAEVLIAPPAEKGPKAPPLTEIPDIRSLLELPQTTVARLESQWRAKYRKEVEEGNAVWLDTEQDLLISFFQRFRNGIYGVWNYPARAAERSQEGTCLLKITVNRDGSLRAVKLVESSGYPLLDREAVAAVKKGAPYGRLPRAYTEEALSIFAFFKYTLKRRVIY